MRSVGCNRFINQCLIFQFLGETEGIKAHEVGGALPREMTSTTRVFTAEPHRPVVVSFKIQRTVGLMTDMAVLRERDIQRFKTVCHLDSVSRRRIVFERTSARLVVIP